MQPCVSGHASEWCSGSHGAVGNKVWFWSAGVDVPVDYPLGDINMRVVFTLDSGKTAVAKYPITINPA